MSISLESRTTIFTTTHMQVAGAEEFNEFSPSADLVVDDNGSGHLRLDVGVHQVDIDVEDLEAVETILYLAIRNLNLLRSTKIVQQPRAHTRSTTRADG